MKKLLLTAMIATLLIVPFQGVAMAENQEALSSETTVSQDSGFVPGEVPAQTDAVQSMTPAVHAMILAMFHYNLTQFDYSNPQLGWETLYNMLSLYGQMDERSEYLNEQLVLPVETARDFSSAIFSSFDQLGALPADLSDRMVYDAEVDSYLVTCGSDTLAEIHLSNSSEAADGTLTLTGTLSYLVDGSDLAQFQATLQPRDNMFGYTITALELVG
ncbi:hypothetical protein DWX58_00185 [Pseudoflavonifractor sp. AF19-9AC]|uniref:hypothetical protein n=1 Tax=Pseudoflavonifractor sp. AF19-9AC TaxID=2292244 RepID=UPI000E47147A|nr:hypothetical protein [Pseudoflavonifractor sp. AF19-9AC]RHR10916.1 hypothetical protein DWX58_00185 [Pseudoflavonifractor sp. AF19-9AC]